MQWNRWAQVLEHSKVAIRQDHKPGQQVETSREALWGACKMLLAIKGPSMDRPSCIRIASGRTLSTFQGTGGELEAIKDTATRLDCKMC